MSVLALHSTMSLLKPGGSRHSDESEENFTFHYVSIKTGENYAELEHTYFFTFHYVSIKTQTGKQIAIVIIPLHSTMSLLKQLQFRSESQPELPLHSTMSLLKRRA
mgnify:CR=1 FL=1